MGQLSALILTLVIESIVALTILRLTGWASDRSWTSKLGIVCAASLITHPFAWYLIVEFRSWAASFWVRAIPVELALTVAEGLLYAWILPVRRWQGLALSLAANGTSFGYGVLL